MNKIAYNFFKTPGHQTREETLVLAELLVKALRKTKDGELKKERIANSIQAGTKICQD